MNIYKDIIENVETRFNTSNYELVCNSIDRLLPQGKNNYLIDGCMDDKKAQQRKKNVMKRKRKFENYKNF